jgi:hypothetical protein
MGGIFSGILNRFICAPQQKRPSLFERDFPPTDHPLRSALDARYAAMRDAMASGQRDAIAALLTSEFVSVNVRGIQTTAVEMIKLVLSLHIDRSKRTATTKLVGIEESAGVARVLQHYAMTTTENVGPAMPKNLQTLSEDTWVNSDGTWLLAKTLTLEVESISGIGARRHAKAKRQTRG